MGDLQERRVSWLSASNEMVTSVLQPQKLNFANSLNELRSGFSPTVSIYESAKFFQSPQTLTYRNLEIICIVSSCKLLVICYDRKLIQIPFLFTFSMILNPSNSPLPLQHYQLFLSILISTWNDMISSILKQISKSLLSLCSLPTSALFFYTPILPYLYPLPLLELKLWKSCQYLCLHVPSFHFSLPVIIRHLTPPTPVVHIKSTWKSHQWPPCC